MASTKRVSPIWWGMVCNWFQIKFEGALEFCRVPPPGFGGTSKTKSSTIVTLSIPFYLLSSVGKTACPTRIAQMDSFLRLKQLPSVESDRLLLEMDIATLELIRDTANIILAFDHEEYLKGQVYSEEPSWPARNMTDAEVVAYRDQMARFYISRGEPVPREVKEWRPR